MSNDQQPPRRARRRWFQFGLRTLLLVTLLMAVLVAYQRERLSRWVDSFWRQPVYRDGDPRSAEQVVRDFLAYSLRRDRKEADLQEAGKLLSRKAFEVTRRRPDFCYGDPARVQIVEVDTRDDGTSRVETVLRVGASEVFDVRWILRSDPEGWRITGFVLLERGAMQPIRTNLENAESFDAHLGRLVERFEP